MRMPPVRFMLDARMWGHGGIGTYVRSLLGALAHSGAVGHCCVLGGGSAAGVTLPSAFCRRPFRAPIYSLAEQLFSPGAVHGTPLWHSPHWNIPLRWQGPLVVTVHDLIPVQFPHWLKMRSATPYAAFLLRQAIRRAGALIAVSETTRRDLCAWGNVDPARVSVIPHGVDPRLMRPVPEAVKARVWQRHDIRPPFVLWVSAIRPHKNPLTALRAFARVRQRHRIPHQLVMIGPTVPWYSVPQREAYALGLDTAVRWVGAVSADELPAFYQGASALVMPSRYEGFGLPVLEAMATGIPVLVSSAPALVELVGNQEVTIHPDEVDAWSDRLYNILFHDELRRTLQEHGLQRARQFTWERSALRHLEVYRTLMPNVHPTSLDRQDRTGP